MRRAGEWACHFWPVYCSFQVIAVFKSNHATAEAEPCTSGSPTMHFGERNHASCGVQPCKLPSGTMQVCECMVALTRVHPWDFSWTFLHGFGGKRKVDANIPRARARAPCLIGLQSLPCTEQCRCAVTFMLTAKWAGVSWAFVFDAILVSFTARQTPCPVCFPSRYSTENGGLLPRFFRPPNEPYQKMGKLQGYGMRTLTF